MNEEIQKLLPRLSGLVDPKIEREIRIAFDRVYDFATTSVIKAKQEILAQLKDTAAKQSKETSELLNEFATRLVQPKTDGTIDTLGNGTVTTFTVSDSSIFTVTNAGSTPNLALNPQAKNKGLFGPTTGADAVPTFRFIVAADLAGLSLDLNIMDWLGQ